MCLVAGLGDMEKIKYPDIFDKIFTPCDFSYVDIMTKWNKVGTASGSSENNIPFLECSL